MDLPHQLLFTAAQSRALDARAIAEVPVDGFVLMQRAADAAFDVLLQTFPETDAVTVVCGKGNNAGDGYLLAVRALQAGLSVQLIAVADPDELQGDAALAAQQAAAAGVQFEPQQAVIRSGVIVDALLGTGIRGAPAEPFASAIVAINRCAERGISVLSLDVPSGVAVDTGAVPGEAVVATVTVSFITRKIGLYTGPGVRFAGQRHLADLGVPRNLADTGGIPLVRWSAAQLPDPDPDTYKHRQGHVVVVGGDADMPGAVTMAAEAALRCGAGMVTVVTRGAHSSVIVARRPEIMVVEAGSERAAQVLALADLLVLGPGLGRTDWGRQLYLAAQATRCATILDADGLYWLSRLGPWTGGALIITPHTAEAARLLASSAREIQQDRIAAATELARRFDCAGVLKGPGSIIFGPAGIAVCAHGNPGMATAGMGDVLSGVIAGLVADCVRSDTDLAQLSRRLPAAVALHSASADAATEALGARSLLASDVITWLPQMLLGAGER